MQPDSLALMIVGWGSALGILAYCAIMLLRHPEESSHTDVDPDNE